MSNRASISDYYYQMRDEIREEINQQSDSYIVGVDADEYTTFLLDKYALPTIEKDLSRSEAMSQQKEWRPIRNAYGEEVKYESRWARIEYPIIPKPNIKWTLQLRRGLLTHLTWEYDARQSLIVLDVEQSEVAIRRALEQLEKEIQLRNQAIAHHNRKLETDISQAIAHRRQQVKKQISDFDELINKIGIPLKQKPLSSRPVIDFSVRKEIKALVAPAPKRRDEYVIERSTVLEVIELIRKAGQMFEVAPAVFSKLEEPDLRFIILSVLNAIFESGATGETFSKRGPTDIYLVIPRGGILIAECKFWRGQKEYRGTIDQLFGYLTWRHNYGIMITFSKNKDFSKVLQRASVAIHSHPTYLSRFQQLSRTHFQSSHTFPEDRGKIVEIHHLFFSLYTPPPTKPSNTPAHNGLGRPVKELNQVQIEATGAD
jgi:hypothetical protein